ncbi:SDR family NAD(P)-dependent oxidoreductase, partial [Streptomyces sp. 8N706]|uniref:SDR family NAD(P)-dependent oxidoreductase n=1 Tax=Streptomyces sp. 8N706 TaxID=3457416 RepID=UPI003FD0BAE5
HPLLTAKIDLPDGTTLHTGEINPHTHPWTTEHTVNNTALLPGTALVDLMWHVAGEAGLSTVGELALHAPVPVPDQEPAPVRVSVAPEDAQELREATVHTLAEDGSWVHHATAMLGTEPARSAESLAAWPPPGAEPVEVDGLYDELAAAGLEYGPTFRAVRFVWRDDQHTYAELALPDGTDADRHELHPALLDAALHPLALGQPGEEREPTMPFAFTGATLYARDATRLRVRLTPRGPEALGVLVADTNGAPVADVEELRLRAVPATTAARMPRNALFRLAWRPVDESPATDRAGEARYVVVGDDDLVEVLNGTGSFARAWPDLAVADSGEADRPTAVLLRYPGPADPGELGDAVLAAVQHHAATLRDWLDDEGRADIPLVVTTTGAVATEPDAPLDLVHAPLWGMTRSAQAEYPGRVILLDLDPAAPHRADLADLLEVALASEEPQLAVRDGVLLAARLAPVPAPAPSSDALGPDRTVLITGANGGVAHHIAEHLVVEHGVRNLLLLSRTRPDALAEHITSLGGRPIALACDVASRSEVAEALAAVPAEHPLQAVVHTAAVLDDATLHGLTAQQLAQVLGPKVRGTLVLHELTRELGLSSFVLYSSASAAFGGAGQAAYTAANGFLDAFAHDRRAAGEPVTSVGWGLWDTGTGMAATLAETDLRRVRRGGIVAMTPAQALGLHDLAPDAGHAHLIASPVRTSALRRSGAHPLLRDLVRGEATARLRSAANTEDTSELVVRLRRQSAPERQETLLALVNQQANDVLGHPSGHVIDAGQPFRDLGFDSLTAVELRNRLHAATGLRLPATLVFDHPRPDALAGYLGTRLLGEYAAAADEPAAPAAADEPIAIIGLACRFPGGVDSPDDLWRLLAEGRDGIGDFPTDRGWDLEALFDENPDRTGTSYAREGGFLDGAADFDAAFFGISPREALAMDPQQRLLLETAWHSIEHAGIDPTTLRSTPTGIFTGISSQDYTRLAQDLPPEVEGYLGTGNAGSVLSGRLAYVLGLEGPAMTVDTACSSSLVALHLAAQSLRSGESTLALAGGVTVMATPSVFIEFSRQRGLAPDGRSKAFSARADGMGPAEGLGVLLLEKLSDARRNNRRIHAVIRGSAVNQDGASNGLSAPSGPAQQRVIRSALAGAGLINHDIDAVEAHGTGTALGDPIEAQALLETYGAERTAPLYVGSVKSNIGHTQAAAGVAGVLKMVLAMQHGVVPATLHADEPTPHVDWSGPVVLAGANTPWPKTGRPRRAAVSSFGISGTNAHLILEQAPEAPTTEAAQDTGLPVPVLLSARTPEALRHQAQRLHDRLGQPDAPTLGRAAQVLATGRTAFPHRLALVGGAEEDLRAALARVAAGEPVADAAAGVAREGQTAFLFTGQGAQRAAGAELYARFPVFAKALDEVCAALDQHLEGPARDLVLNPTQDDLGRTGLMQPAVFALQVALAELLADEYGVRPHALLGHSVGEVTAAHIAGVLDLPDAAALIAARGRLMAQLPTDGAMVAIAATEREVLAAIEGREREVAVAAVNGPRATVLSGTAAVVEQIAERFAARGVRTKRLRVSRAFHSPQLDELLAEFRSVSAGVSFAAPRLTLVSNVTGRVVADEVCTAEYWVRQARQPVRFADGVGELVGLGATRFLELGPDAVLTPLARDLVPAGHVVRPVLRRERDEAETLAAALTGLWADGATVRWQGLLPGGGVPAEVPGYGFDRARYWLAGGFGVTAGRPAPPPMAEEDLAALPPAERAAKVADLVRRTMAAVLGHADASALGPNERFTDLGMDSMAAVELRGRLDTAARIRLDTTAVFDHPTVEALTAHIAELLDSPQGEAVIGGLGALYWTACADGRLAEAGDLLRAAARLRPAFTAAAPPTPAVPVALADGDAPVPVLCLPSFSTVAGPHEFAGFATALPGAREVWALPEPGFGPGEAIPADLAALVAAQASAAREAARGRPCVLVGRSASGLLVNSLAAELEASGSRVRAVVLLDVYPPSLTRAQPWVEQELTQAVAERENLPALYNDARLMAMGRYFEAFADWGPTPTTAPTLHVRAQDPFAAHLADPAQGYGDWRSAWDLPHDVVDVPGDHFSILDACAGSTAAAVGEWLDKR